MSFKAMEATGGMSSKRVVVLQQGVSYDSGGALKKQKVSIVVEYFASEDDASVIMSCFFLVFGSLLSYRFVTRLFGRISGLKM